MLILDDMLVLSDPNQNVETSLPDMPNGVARVYPASGAVAMLPLTRPTTIPPPCSSAVDRTCHWTTTETTRGRFTTPGHTRHPQTASVSRPSLRMGQFIIHPDGTMLVINGATNGTAGFANQTFYVPSLDQMPFFQSLASGPVGTPAIYNPNTPKGSRWSNVGLGSSSIARMYHSTAILLPDASVLIAGSNPNLDVELTAPYPTTYTAEIFYPPYFSSGVPQTLGYGGPYFNLTVSSASYKGTSGNSAAANTTVVLSRGGFTTHAMNMGQRHL